MSLIEELCDINYVGINDVSLIFESVILNRFQNFTTQIEFKFYFTKQMKVQNESFDVKILKFLNFQVNVLTLFEPKTFFKFYQLIHTLATYRRLCSPSIFTDDYLSIILKRSA